MRPPSDFGRGVAIDPANENARLAPGADTTGLQSQPQSTTVPAVLAAQINAEPPAGARLDTHAFPNETRRALFAPDFTRASPALQTHT